MDFGGLLVLGLVWLLFNFIGQAKGGSRTTKGRVPPRPSAPPRAPGAGDPTQQEGSRLERLLRELERSLEEAAGAQAGSRSQLPLPQRPSAPPLPAPTAGLPAPIGEAEDVEERDSLEEPEQVVSLETDVHRRERAEYDQDTDAEAIVRRRIEAARVRDRALSKVDHTAFDARIRQEPADHTAVRRYTPAQLRDAVVWREILGPPVSEREG
jgi:hypothetical protein